MKTELMTANRNFVLAGQHPWTIQVYRDQPTQIPRSMVRDAIAAGMIFVEAGEKTAEVLAEKSAPKLLAGEDLVEKVYEAFESCIERNSPADFAASGIPAQAAVSTLVGQKIDQKEITRMWRTFKKEQEEKASAIADSKLTPPAPEGE